MANWTYRLCVLGAQLLKAVPFAANLTATTITNIFHTQHFGNFRRVFNLDRSLRSSIWDYFSSESIDERLGSQNTI